MLAFAPILSLLFLLASQVSAFNFNVTFGTENLPPTQVLPPLTGTIQNCASTTSNCSAVNATLTNCGLNATCLCDPSLVKSLLGCEECMYTALITANKPLPDLRAGSTPMLQAYQAACGAFNFTVTTAQVALTLPANWDGPFGQGLNLAGTVVSVGAAFILGMGSLFLLSNLE